MKKYCWMIGLVLVPILIGLGCGDLGKVEQGRVIQFDKTKWTVTLVRDRQADPQNPDYCQLPPITFALPADPQEMGPEPKAGLRIKLDTKNNQIVFFDPASQNFKTIQYTLIDQKEKIAKDNPLVLDEGKPKKFPIIDREKKAITVYSKRQQILTTFTIPEEYFGLPENTWDAGDEVRIYYKEEGKARRFMNITKTDIFKK
ncbi:MAG: DUF4881 domain-containing protein [Deltaproteobacteria bacterium]|nr:DUF4881 domain-containing protein [Deltaproteobacteria bacterium]